MMDSEKYTEFINTLVARTAEKKLIWQKSSSTGEFKLQMGKGSLTIMHYSNGFSNEPNSVVINIYNEDGDQIETFDIDEGMAGYDRAAELFAVVRRSYFKVDETINSMFDELKSGNIIGTSDDPLPF